LIISRPSIKAKYTTKKPVITQNSKAYSLLVTISILDVEKTKTAA